MASRTVSPCYDQGVRSKPDDRRVVAAAVLLLVGVHGCSRSDGDLERRIAAEASRDLGALVRIESLTDFAWEQLHVFPPYSSQDWIDSQLGFAWPAAARTGIFDSDGIALLVFVRDSEVVRYVAQPRGKGDFAYVKGAGTLTPASAVFVVREDIERRRVFHLAKSHRPVTATGAAR